jgi:putative endonuclease
MADERPRASPIQAPRPERQIAFRTGISAESRAAAFLVAKGFRILARRWKSPVGEIDIIARRRTLLVFVEVKARERFDDAAWSVTDRQRLRIAAAAEAWLARYADSRIRDTLRRHLGGAGPDSTAYHLRFRSHRLMQSGDRVRYQNRSSGRR